MKDFRTISLEIKEKLGMQLSPVGMLFSEKMPDNSLHLKKKRLGCITPLIFKSAKGKVVAFNDDSTGWPCSSFYLGYSEWIFPGIENFLSNESVHGREPERFLKSPKIAKEFVESYTPKEKRRNTIIFKPLELFLKSEKPELVIFFANADQLSALVYLITFGAPMEERIVTQFASACMSIFTVPLKYANEGRKKAVWGLHDVSVRKSLPKDLMSLSMPYNLFMEVYNNISDSFIMKENWEKLKRRNL